MFYGQAKASEEDIKKLSEYFSIDHSTLLSQLTGFPDRGKSVEMPPKEPLIYRLYEIVQNYGYAYKAVLNEKFGDGIMSAISFSTHVEKEVDKDGVTWVSIPACISAIVADFVQVNINLRGKWYETHHRDQKQGLTDCLQVTIYTFLDMYDDTSLHTIEQY